MSDDDIETLRRRMAEAVAAEDYEAAARLRDRIAALSGKEGESLFNRQVPGRMGLGTDQQVMAPAQGLETAQEARSVNVQHQVKAWRALISFVN